MQEIIIDDEAFEFFDAIESFIKNDGEKIELDNVWELYNTFFNYPFKSGPLTIKTHGKTIQCRVGVDYRDFSQNISVYPCDTISNGVFVSFNGIIKPNADTLGTLVAKAIIKFTKQYVDKL